MDRSTCAFWKDAGTDLWHEHDHAVCEDVVAEEAARYGSPAPGTFRTYVVPDGDVHS